MKKKGIPAHQLYLNSWSSSGANVVKDRKEGVGSKTVGEKLTHQTASSGGNSTKKN